jgi:hypothetical protein
MPTALRRHRWRGIEEVLRLHLHAVVLEPDELRPVLGHYDSNRRRKSLLTIDVRPGRKTSGTVGMMSRHSLICILLLPFLLIGCATAQRAADESGHLEGVHVLSADPAVADAARYTDWLFSGQIDSLWHSLSDRGRDRFPVPDSLDAWRDAVMPVLPGFEQVLADSVERSDTLVTVWRLGVNERDGAAYYVWWRLTPEDHRITSLGARDAGRAAETPMLHYEPQTRLRLPFDGEWIVFWGGHTYAENYHAAYPHQRFALDLMPAEDSVTIFRAAAGEPVDITDFACFGWTILAPASGLVVTAIDTVPDNPLGQFHPTSELGNHLVIRHHPDEYSLLAHLRQGSLQVSSGDSVQAGDPVAQCGNSGRTTAPHLHYDLRNSTQITRGTFSLPAKFYDYFADATFVERGEPRRWQRIRPADDETYSFTLRERRSQQLS